MWEMTSGLITRVWCLHAATLGSDCLVLSIFCVSIQVNGLTVGSCDSQLSTRILFPTLESTAYSSTRVRQTSRLFMLELYI